MEVPLLTGLQRRQGFIRNINPILLYTSLYEQLLITVTKLLYTYSLSMMAILDTQHTSLDVLTWKTTLDFSRRYLDKEVPTTTPLSNNDKTGDTQSKRKTTITNLLRGSERLITYKLHQ